MCFEKGSTDDADSNHVVSLYKNRKDQVELLKIKCKKMSNRNNFN